MRIKAASKMLMQLTPGRAVQQNQYKWQAFSFSSLFILDVATAGFHSNIKLTKPRLVFAHT